MDFSLSEEQRMLRDTIIRFAEKELNDGIDDRDARHAFSRPLWDACGRMGLQGLPVDEAHGGMNLDPLSTALALEALGYGCHDGGLVFSVCAHLLACVVPVWKHGTEAQKARYLPRLCDGSLIAVNAMTEPNTGSDAFAMSTRAVPDGDGFRISGTKIFGSNAPVADVAVLYAMTDSDKGYHGGITAFLVEHDTPGFSRGQTFQKLGLRTCAIGELVLDDVKVGPEAVLGGVGGGSTLFTQSMEWERICLVAAHLGTMQRLLEQAINHARSRTQFGQTIGKFQAVSHRIADMKVRLEASRLMTYQAASRLDRVRSVALESSMTKLFVSESLLKSALDTVQILGGYGFMTEYQAERTLRDSVGSTLYSGTSEMQREIIARWLGL